MTKTAQEPLIIIIHGTTGNPDGNWFPWLKQELSSLGYEANVPSFPTPNGQSLEAWKKVFYDLFESVQSNMILVGHSIGPGFILNLLDEAEAPVLATFMVCGFTGTIGLPYFDKLNQSFVCREFDWKKIRHNMGKACLFASDNDPYVPLEKSQELAKNLQIPLTVIPGAKHINSEAGYTNFPLLLEKIKHCLIPKKEVRVEKI